MGLHLHAEDLADLNCDILGVAGEPSLEVLDTVVEEVDKQRQWLGRLDTF